MQSLFTGKELIDKDLKYKLKLYFNISLGIFLFILFFQPFELYSLDFNDRLLFIAGFSTITFLLLGLFHLFLSCIFPKTFDFAEWKYNPDLFLYSMILICNSAAYTFYIHYVGNIPVSFYLVFKISLLSIAPLVVLKISKEYKILIQQVHSLHEENKKLLVHSSNVINNNIMVETFFSENKSEKIDFELNNILFINSADNYIKIVYKKNDEIKNKLIRNTLKNIEEQLNKYPDFFRCHRTCIVNKKHVENLSRSYKGYGLIISNYKDEIPVSRQYIMKVRETLDTI